MKNAGMAELTDALDSGNVATGPFPPLSNL